MDVSKMTHYLYGLDELKKLILCGKTAYKFWHLL